MLDDEADLPRRMASNIGTSVALLSETASADCADSLVRVSPIEPLSEEIPSRIEVSEGEVVERYRSTCTWDVGSGAE